MKFSRRSSADAIEGADVQPDLIEAVGGSGKGRPTPKRRDGTRRPTGPVAAPPRTQRESAKWQRERAKDAKSTVNRSKLTGPAYRAAVKAGDPSVLPKRDQGAARTLARDYVDSRRMIANYLFALLILVLVGSFVPALQILSLVTFVVVIIVGLEGFRTGRAIRALVIEREGTTRESAASLGFYAVSRASMPRRWRIPIARVSVGDKI